MLCLCTTQLKFWFRNDLGREHLAGSGIKIATDTVTNATKRVELSLPTAPIKLVSRCISPSPMIKLGENSPGGEHWMSTAIFHSWWSTVKSVNVCRVYYVNLFILSMEVSMVSYFAGGKSTNCR